jgi:hypothetical protein
VGATRNEHAPRGGFDGHIVRAAVSLDIKFSTLNVCAFPLFGAARMLAKRTADAVMKRLVIRGVFLTRYRSAA